MTMVDTKTVTICGSSRFIDVMAVFSFCTLSAFVIEKVWKWLV